SLVDTVGSAFGNRAHSLQNGAGGSIDLGNIQLLGIHAEVVFCICAGALQQLCHGLAGSLGGRQQDGHGGLGILTADQIADDLDLAGRDADKFGFSSCVHILLHPPYFVPVLFATWPRNVRVGANSPSLWPTMSSVIYTGTCFLPSWTAMV